MSSRICGPCSDGQGVLRECAGSAPSEQALLTNFASATSLEVSSEDGVCRATSQEAALVNEVREEFPNLAAIRILLDEEGVSPNIVGDANGAPLLFVAATLLHADVVSVLLTAGANSRVKFGGVASSYNPRGDDRSLPEFLTEQANMGNVSLNQSFGRFLFLLETSRLAV